MDRERRSSTLPQKCAKFLQHLRRRTVFLFRGGRVGAQRVNDGQSWAHVAQYVQQRVSGPSETLMTVVERPQNKIVGRGRCAYIPADSLQYFLHIGDAILKISD